MDIEFRPRDVIDVLLAEGALYAFLYYIQILLKVEDSLWLSSLILWALLNVAIIFCPVVKRCYK